MIRIRDAAEGSALTAIAFVSTAGSVSWGGSEHLWVEVAARLAQQGHHVAACVRDQPELDPHILALRADGVTLTTWPAPTFARKVLRKLTIDRTKMRLGKYDVLVVSSGGTTDLLGNKRLQATMKELYQNGKPFVVAVHSNTDHFLPYPQRLLLRKFYSASSAVVLPAYRLRHEIERLLAVSLPNSMELPTPTPLIGAVPSPYPPSDTLRMATVGRLYATQKGQDLLLAALAEVSWRDEAWSLDVFGDGPDDAYLRDLSVFYGLEPRVHFEGYSENVGAVWEDHHVLMMPSRIEARGIAITEAMACGRAVVASAVGGIPDTVTDGETGILVAAPSVEEWVKSLERLWSERAALPAWGANGRKRVQETFADDVIQRVVDVVLNAAHG